MKKGDAKAHSIWDNLRFAARVNWQTSRSSILLPALQIPSDLAVAALAAFLPSIVIYTIEQKFAPLPLMGTVAAAGLFLAVVKCCSLVLSIRSNTERDLVLHNYYERSLLEKVMDMDYELFCSPEGRVKHQKAFGSLWNDRSVFSFLQNAFGLAQNLFGFTAFLAVLIALNPWIILILAVSYVIDIALGIWIDKRVDGRRDEWGRLRMKIDYLAFRTRDLSIAKDIKIYRMSDWLRALSKKSVLDYMHIENKNSNDRSLQSGIELFLVFLRNGFAYGYLIYLMLRPGSALSIAAFTAYFAAITGFAEWLEKLANYVEMFLDSNRSMNHYRAFMDIPDERLRSGGLPLPDCAAPPALSLRNVGYSYEGGEKAVLHGVTLEIQPGEKIAVVGENGAGKTTLVKLICGLIAPSEGEILLNGTDIRCFNRDAYYTLFSAIFQDICYLPASIAKNIALSDEDMNTEKVLKCLDLASLTEKIRSLPKGLDSELVKNVVEDGVELSGGELQRLILARAIYKDAPMMILDEPTASLDPIAENQLYLNYNELTANKTTLYISHRLSSTKFCDRIIFLDGATIAETGTHEELMALKGKYAEMFGIQSHYYQKNKAEGATS